METVQHHIACRTGDVGRYVFLPGDPARADLIAERFDHPVKVAENREYRTFTGEIDGERVSVTSTGIGGPSSAIAVEELAEIGVDTVIRVGTAGPVHPSVQSNTVVIATAAVRQEGTSREYMPIEFPAVAHHDVVVALVAAATEQPGLTWRVGIMQSKDAFYGQHRPDSMPTRHHLHMQWDAWIAGGVLASEMEAATIFVVSALRGLRAGAIVSVGGGAEGIQQTIAVAIAGVRKLITADRG